MRGTFARGGREGALRGGGGVGSRSDSQHWGRGARRAPRRRSGCRQRRALLRQAGRVDPDLHHLTTQRCLRLRVLLSDYQFEGSRDTHQFQVQVVQSTGGYGGATSLVIIEDEGCRDPVTNCPISPGRPETPPHLEA